MDLDSFYKYFLIQEFCVDIDTAFRFLITKRKNDNKSYFYPIFDYARINKTWFEKREEELDI